MSDRIRVTGAVARVFFVGLVRDRTALFFVVVLPVVIIIIIGSVFGESDTSVVGVLDRTGTTAAGDRLVDGIGAAEGTDVRRYDDEAVLRRDVRTGRIDAGMFIPAGFGDVDAVDTSEVILIVDPASRAANAVRPVVSAVLARIGEDVAAGRFAAATIGTSDDEGDELVARARRSIAPVEVAIETLGSSPGAASGRYSYTAPSNLVLFVFVNSLGAAGGLVEMRRAGLARRMLASPVRTSDVLIGAGATQLLFTLAQAALIVVLGAVVFDVSWGDPVAALVLTLTWSVIGAGAGLLVGAVARDADQAQSIAIPVAIGFGMLGGCMWPLAIVPDALRQAGHLTPQAWAMDAWIDLVLDGKGFGAILPELAVLTAFAVLLVGLGSRALHRAITAA